MMAMPLSPTRAQRDAAARWLVRLDGGLDQAGDQEALRRWLAADPRHAQALREAQALWAALEGPVRAEAAHRAQRRGWRRWWPEAGPSRAAWAWAATACVLLGLVGGPLLPAGIGWLADLRADVVAPRGQTRTVTLPDGSTLTLGGHGAVAVDFAAGRRQVHLLRGEAFFAVRPDPGRPFVVVADHAWARVVGTRFDIRQTQERVTVTVEHGIVDVGGDAGGSQRLLAGQAVEVVAGRPGAVVAADLDRVAAWRDGRMVFYRQPLAEVVGQLSGQSAGAIVVADGALAERRISGTFPAGDVAATLAAIGDTLGARVLRLGPWLTILY